LQRQAVVSCVNVYPRLNVKYGCKGTAELGIWA
jgi:hypothetical protein